MNQDHPTNSIQESVLNTVRAQSMRRVPRWHFVFQIVVTALVSVLLLATSALVISFILFSLHESGEQFLLGFGLRGIQVFLHLFPWALSILTFLLLILLEWLLRKFRFGYRIPLLNIFLVIVFLSVILGVLINATPLHTSLLMLSNNNRLPFVGDAYQDVLAHHDDQGVSRGIVISTSTDSFTLQHNDHDHDRDDGTFMVLVAPGSGLAIPLVGQEVLVFGDPQPGFLQAEHIQILQNGTK